MKFKNLALPYELKPFFRSNHAFETGAIYIYKAIIKFSKDKRILKFAKKHLETEKKHLELIEKILPKAEFSKLISLWKFFGFMTGFIPVLLGNNFVYTTIYYVETFVERHYKDQLLMLNGKTNTNDLQKLIHSLMNDEIDHKEDAENNIKKLNFLNKIWGNIISYGSSFAVEISKRV